MRLLTAGSLVRVHLKAPSRYGKPYREQSGPLVKRLRHRPFTAVTRVRFSHGSPEKKHRQFCRCFFCRYKFLTEFAICLRHDILLRNAICPFRTRKEIYIISQSNKVRLYRIYEVNISSKRSLHIAFNFFTLHENGISPGF